MCVIVNILDGLVRIHYCLIKLYPRPSPSLEGLSGFVALGQDLQNQNSTWRVVQNYLLLLHVKDNGVENKAIPGFVNSRAQLGPEPPGPLQLSQHKVLGKVIFKKLQFREKKHLIFEIL